MFAVPSRQASLVCVVRAGPMAKPNRHTSLDPSLTKMQHAYAWSTQ